MIRLLSCLLLTFLIANCTSPGKPKNFDYGKTVDNVYTNNFFDLEVTLPEGWSVQSQAQTEELAKIGQDMIAGEDSDFRAAILASEINIANLLSVFQFELGTPVAYNPCFALVAENVSSGENIREGKDYLTEARNFLNQSQVKYNHIDEIFTKEIINGTTFYIMDCNIDYMGNRINQRYYSTVKNGFALNAIISFIDEEQRAALEATVGTMKIKG